MRAARAEAAWLAGDRERAVAEARAAWDLAVRHRHPWHTGELASGAAAPATASGCPRDAARPFALQIDGDWRRAAAAWERLGCPYEAARALADGDEPPSSPRVEILDRLGARPDLDRLRQRLRAAGVRAHPARPAAEHARQPFGLTAREVEIAALLARG